MIPLVSLDPVALVAAIGSDQHALRDLVALLSPALVEHGAGAPAVSSPYMGTGEVAEYLRLPRGKDRVYELFHDGTLSRLGTRNHALALRSEVEDYARGRT